VQESEAELVALQHKLEEQRTKAAESLLEVTRLKDEVATLGAAVATSCGSNEGAAASGSSAMQHLTKMHVHALQEMCKHVNPQAAAEHAAAVSQIVAALQATTTAAASLDVDFCMEGQNEDGYFEELELDLDDDSIATMATLGVPEAAGYATASPEQKIKIKDKCSGHIKGQLKASADKRKSDRILQGIALKTKKTKA
jgi:hypothetical protein